MKNIVRMSLYICLVLSTSVVYGTTCHFYNKTPYDIIVNSDIPLAPDKELRIPANDQGTCSTGIFPVRSYIIHALVSNFNDKNQQKIQVYESNNMEFRTLKCSLFIEPRIARDPNQKNKRILDLDSIKFWAVSEHPEHGEEVEL